MMTSFLTLLNKSNGGKDSVRIEYSISLECYMGQGGK